MKRYKELLAENLTAPMKMELMVANADGSSAHADHQFRMRQLRPDLHAGWQEDPVRVQQG